MTVQARPHWTFRACPCCKQAAAEAPRAIAAPAGPHRIDVHHHLAPPAWLAEVRGRNLLQPATAAWSPEKSIEDMDRGGVAAAIVSVTNPGLWFSDRQQTSRLARASNDYMARLVQDRPTRFGMFAAMPMPDPDATLREIEYACDVLKADGIGLFTSYADIWLGNSAFEPVMAELNRRKALVFVHPTAPNCALNLIPDVQPGVMEYGTDTTRAILGVLTSGQAVRYPDIRFIWSHAGGTAPFLAGRIEASITRLPDHATRLPRGAIAEMQRFYYDVAGAANAGALVSLTQLVAASQVLFGTDFPSGLSRDIIAGLDTLGFCDADLRAIERENALTLLPRFAH
jgi:predicted TIM-barrel fold metal-dependent hydrolase